MRASASLSLMTTGLTPISDILGVDERQVYRLHLILRAPEGPANTPPACLPAPPHLGHHHQRWPSAVWATH